ncbi:hypothetical protein DFH06DRAFT_1146753 [Mycena polygramma]|nr:hypothetical protein DFH06DRAFT_1146753 [Mycena polygramma]
MRDKVCFLIQSFCFFSPLLLGVGGARGGRGAGAVIEARDQGRLQPRLAAYGAGWVGSGALLARPTRNASARTFGFLCINDRAAGDGAVRAARARMRVWGLSRFFVGRVDAVGARTRIRHFPGRLRVRGFPLFWGRRVGKTRIVHRYPRIRARMAGAEILESADEARAGDARLTRVDDEDARGMIRHVFPGEGEWVRVRVSFSAEDGECGVVFITKWGGDSTIGAETCRSRLVLDVAMTERGRGRVLLARGEGARTSGPPHECIGGCAREREAERGVSASSSLPDEDDHPLTESNAGAQRECGEDAEAGMRVLAEVMARTRLSAATSHDSGWGVRVGSSGLGVYCGRRGGDEDLVSAGADGHGDGECATASRMYRSPHAVTGGAERLCRAMRHGRRRLRGLLCGGGCMPRWSA